MIVNLIKVYLYFFAIPKKHFVNKKKIMSNCCFDEHRRYQWSTYKVKTTNGGTILVFVLVSIPRIYSYLYENPINRIVKTSYTK